MRQLCSRRVAILAASLIAAAGFASCGGDDAEPSGGKGRFAESPEVTLNFTYPFGADHHLMTNVLAPWFDEITKETDGTVKFNLHPNSSLADPEEIYDLTAAGAIEAGWSLPAYTPGKFPLSEIVELPFTFDSAEQATGVFWDLMKSSKDLSKEYEDVVVLGIYVHDPGDLFTSVAVESPDDVEGLKIRTPGALTGEVVSTLGGSPVSIAATEVYDALDRGVVDGYMTSREGVVTLGLEEVTKYATLAGFYVGPAFIVMNRETYDELSPEQRAVIDKKRGRVLSLEAAESFDAASAKAVKAYEAAGMTLNEMPEDEVETWRNAVQPVIDDWLDRQAKDGRPGPALYESMLEFRDAK